MWKSGLFFEIQEEVRDKRGEFAFLADMIMGIITVEYNGHRISLQETWVDVFISPEASEIHLLGIILLCFHASLKEHIR